jgi:hypothetical protein
MVERRTWLSTIPRHSSAHSILKLGPVNRYHFHVFNGRAYEWDPDGVLLGDLAAVVAEAESRAQVVMSTRADIHCWRTWMVDVRGNDDITLFHYPFEEIAKAVKDMPAVAHYA